MATMTVSVDLKQLLGRPAVKDKMPLLTIKRSEAILAQENSFVRVDRDGGHDCPLEATVTSSSEDASASDGQSSIPGLSNTIPHCRPLQYRSMPHCSAGLSTTIPQCRPLHSPHGPIPFQPMPPSLHIDVAAWTLDNSR